jgi:hypothetical protein
MEKETRYKIIQIVRIADLVIIAPYLIYLSTIIKSKVHKKILFITGVGVFLFNGYNLLKDKDYI